MHAINRHWWIVDWEEPNPLLPVNEAIEVIEGLLVDVLDRWEDWPASRQVAARAVLEDTVNGPGPRFREPLVQRTRGRPVGANAQHAPANSTRRDPSAFEHVEAQVGDNRARNRCSRCMQRGHNARRCQQAAANVPDEARESL